MKLITLIISLAVSLPSFAQRSLTLGLKAGNYIEDWYVSDFYNANFRIEFADVEHKTKLSRSALFIMDAETRIKGMVYLGAGLSYQYSSLFVPEHKLPPASGGDAEALTINLHRTTISLKPTFHYVRWLRLDLYSGMRMGYEFLRFRDNSSDPGFELKEKEFIEINFVPQFILLGLNVDIFKRFAANVECAYGQPGYVSAGLIYRFGR